MGAEPPRRSRLWWPEAAVSGGSMPRRRSSRRHGRRRSACCFAAASGTSRPVTRAIRKKHGINDRRDTFRRRAGTCLTRSCPFLLPARRKEIENEIGNVGRDTDRGAGASADGGLHVAGRRSFTGLVDEPIRRRRFGRRQRRKRLLSDRVPAWPGRARMAAKQPRAARDARRSAHDFMRHTGVGCRCARRLTASGRAPTIRRPARVRPYERVGEAWHPLPIRRHM